MTVAIDPARSGSRCAARLSGLNLLATIGIVSIFCLASEAKGQLLSGELEGRWVSAKPALTLDISRCVSGWCGVKVNGSSCASTVLRLGAGKQLDRIVAFSGSLQLASESEPYRVNVDLIRRDGALAVVMRGNVGELPRRTFDFLAEFVRIDKPSCTPDSKVS